MVRMRIRRAAPESVLAPPKGVPADSDLAVAVAKIRQGLAGISGTLEVVGGAKFGKGSLMVRWVNRENTEPGSLDWHNSTVSVTLWSHDFDANGKAAAKVKIESPYSKRVRGKTGPLDAIVGYIIKSIKGLADTIPDDRVKTSKTQRTATLTATQQAVVAAFYDVMKTIKSAVQIDDVTVIDGHHEGFVSATIVVDRKELETYGLPPQRMNSGYIQAEIDANADGTTTLRMSADGDKQSIIMMIADGKYRFLRKQGTHPNMDGLAVQIATPLARASVRAASMVKRLARVATVLRRIERARGGE